MLGWMDEWMNGYWDGLGAFDGAVLLVYFGENFSVCRQAGFLFLYVGRVLFSS